MNDFSLYLIKQVGQKSVFITVQSPAIVFSVESGTTNVPVLWGRRAIKTEVVEPFRPVALVIAQVLQDLAILGGRVYFVQKVLYEVQREKGLTEDQPENNGLCYKLLSFDNYNNSSPPNNSIDAPNILYASMFGMVGIVLYEGLFSTYDRL